MPNRDLIVVGASAGGIEALKEMVSGLPDDIPASVLVVLHMPATGGPVLERILSRETKLRVRIATDGAALEHGCLYVARGDYHLLVGEGRVHVRQGPREDGHRPAVDPLFRSAAAYYGPRVIGVILSGGLSDGTAGLFSVRHQGGLAVIQDPAEALYDGMPGNALEYVGADFVVSARDIGPLLGRLAEEVVEAEPPTLNDHLRKEVEMIQSNEGPLGEHPGRPSPWPCPVCNGVLWEIEDGPILRFRCRVGHAWAADSLLEQQAEGVEGALWMALRALEDRAALSEQLAERASEGGRRLSASRYREELDGMTRNIDILRFLLAARAPRTGEGDVSG